MSNLTVGQGTTNKYSEVQYLSFIQATLINNYKDFLIEKGILDETGKKVIDQRKFTALIKEARGKGAGATQLINAFLRSLGYEKNPIVNIPEAAFDSPIDKAPVGGFAQSRIAYMRMSGMPLDGSRLGLPLGGLATGSVMRSPDGSFPTIDFMDIGRNIWDPNGNIASQFHVYVKSSDGKTTAQTLCTRTPDDPKKLSTWKWNLGEKSGSYHALYPYSWWTYNLPGSPAKIAITGFSPVIFNNYKESTYPVVVYKVRFKNTSNKKIDASTMFTFQNLVGWKATNQNTWSPDAAKKVATPGIRSIFPDAGQDPDKVPAQLLTTEFDKASSGDINTVAQDGQITAILMDGKSDNSSAQGQIAIATPNNPKVKISYQSRFDSDGDGHEVSSFFSSGTLQDSKDAAASNGENIGGALAVSVSLDPGEEIEIPFVLAYDFPKQGFGKDVIKDKAYTEFFGTSGKSAMAIATEAIKKYQSWETQIAEGEKPVLSDPTLPSWFKGEAINMLSLLQSDGIYWGKAPESGNTFHVMGESNGADYKHAETRDVGIYDPSRAMFWPKLHNGLMKHFAWSVDQERAQVTPFNEMQYKIPGFDKLNPKEKKDAISAQLQKDGVPKKEADMLSELYYAPLKPKGATPHDIGAYDSDPTNDLNSYTHQNPNAWAELSMVWILEAYRNFSMGGKQDKTFVDDIYQGVKDSIAYAEKMDLDGDHIPDHRGIPDWTYDNWKVKGINSYTAGLWLTTLEAGIEMAKISGDTESETKWRGWLQTGKASFEKKLWDPAKGYYRLSEGSDDAFADQLWLLWPKITDLQPVVSNDRAVSHLKYIYTQNVKGFGGGYLGAVNGTRNGKPIEGEQEREMWTGTSYALGSTMLAYGLKEQGWQTIFGTYNMTTNKAQMFGAWAEAYTIEPGIGNGPMYGFRARTYYRALAIWNTMLALHPKQ